MKKTQYRNIKVLCVKYGGMKIQEEEEEEDDDDTSGMLQRILVLEFSRNDDDG